ncbi:MAG: xanthine dehydrogenase family protein molybdopterin-binding subunit [Candidatus Sumerlaeaceae bacterium]|nr:xanthine dehydrogenase family protein molybdopterin-binding subunit [Candidatus Sumerlaeaceae bacterium]
MTERKISIGFPGAQKEITVEVPEGTPPPWDLKSAHTVVGTDVTRVDGAEKVTGRAKYTYDLNLPGMLHGRILRSPHPAAVVKKVDISAAARMPGVKAIVLAFDEGQIGTKRVRYAGDEILALAADTPAHAEEAIRAVKVEYETLPFVVDLDEAEREGAPQVYKDQPNVKPGRPRGNADEAAKRIAAAAVAVEATFRTQVQTHSPLETHGHVIMPDGEGLKVWASTQGVFSVRDGLAGNLGLKPEQVRVITEYMGGGFGAKFGPRAEGVLCAKLARKAGAPVKLMLDRKEEHLAAGNRPNSRQEVKAGADKDGKLVGIIVRTRGTGGVGGGAGCTIPAIYDFPEDGIYKEEADVHTNAGAAAAMRAPGHPQGIFALEQTMDMLAHELGLDPLEFRMRNDSDPIRREQYKIGAKRIGWASRRNKTPGAGTGHLRRGIGMASTLWYAAGGRQARADVEIHRDGTVVLMQGAQDIGTGFKTAIAAVVAEELGLKPSNISVKTGDTRLGYGPGSGGSTTTPTVAPAVREAAYAAKLKVFEAAAAFFKSKPEHLRAADGMIWVEDGSGAGAENRKSLSWKQACALLPADKVTGSADRRPNTEGFRNTTAGVQFAEVEVDIETGIVRVIKVVAVQDAGLTLNTLAAKSQIAGGVIQGVSFALFEDRIMDRARGLMVNPNFMDYKIAGPADCPEIEPVVFQVANGKNSVGAMGLGESPVIPTPAAIANAIFNATGARVFELPMTPDRVLAALQKKGGEKSA